MKVGAKVHVFNFNMRERRRELGMTQFELSELAGVNIDCLQRIERLELIPGAAIDVADKLQRIANALEVSFESLFPSDYLKMLQDAKLPRRRTPFIWCREISLEALPPAQVMKMLPAPDDLVAVEEQIDRDLLKERMRAVLSTLSPTQQKVIELRYGLGDSQTRTLNEVARMLGVTGERIRQVEAKILRQLRNPIRSRELRPILVCNQIVIQIQLACKGSNE